LRAMQSDLPRGRLSRAIDVLASSLEAGKPTATAMAQAAGWLPAHVRGMLAAGVHSGRLAEVLEESLAQEQLRAESRRRMISVMAYPMFVLTLFLGWMAFVLIVLMPSMNDIYTGFQIDLPGSTQLLVWLSGPQKWLFLVPLAALDAAPLLLGTISHTYAASWLLARIPLVGPAWRARNLIGFCNLLAALIEQSVALPAALQLTADGLDDGELKAACREAAIEAAAGQSLSGSIAAAPAFPNTLVPMIRWGEQTSNVSEALRSAAELYMKRLEIQTQLLSIVVPPVAFVVVGAATLWVLGATMMPLLKLISSLSG
jgi:type II secretory pathway component PulF